MPGPHLHPEVQRGIRDPGALLAVGEQPLVVAAAQTADVRGGVAPRVPHRDEVGRSRVGAAAAHRQRLGAIAVMVYIDRRRLPCT